MSLKSKIIFKNYFGVFLLLFIITAIFIPGGEAKAIDLFSFDIFGSLTEWVSKLALGDSAFMTTIYWLVYRIVSLGLYATIVLVYFGSWLVDVFLDPAIYTRVLDMNDKTSAVYIGWTTVRDACNTFFILFLLVIAFATILRIQAYNAKSLLPKLIISLFLINFSAVITMMVIDFGQVFMFGIKEWMGAGGFANAGSPLTTIVDYFHNQYGLHKSAPSGEGSYLMSDVVGVIFAVSYSAILGIMYIMLALFLMVRLIVFVILVIISPFAFFSIILPGMRTYTSQWWQSLVSHALFGPVFLFFIFLSSKMAQSMHGFASSAPKPGTIEPLSYIIAELIPHVVALGMLIAAVPITQKLGVAGANKIIGGAAGIGKVAMGTYAGIKLAGGGAKKMGGWTGRKAGIDSRKIGDWSREATKKVGSKIPGGVGKRIEGTIVLKEAGIKAKDRKNIEEKKGEIKELSGTSAIIAAKGIEAKKLRKGESLNKEDETKFIALVEHAASKGEKLEGNFSDNQLAMVAQRGADLDNIAKYDPIAAGKMKYGIDKSKTEKEHTEEYMQEHAETGDWKKYNAHVRQNHFDEIQENVDSKELENHIKRSGKKANHDYEIGADKYMQELVKGINDANAAGDVALEADLRAKLIKAREKIRKATGNFEISDAKRNATGYRQDDTAAHTQIEHGEKASAGNVDLHRTGVQEAIKVSGGNDFKKLKKESKVIYAQHAQNAGDIAGLQLKEEDSEVLREMADAIRHSGYVVANKERRGHEILQKY